MICTGLLFLFYEIWMAGLGFGEDTDAWLMAQTAEKIRMGLGYDPARSFGNPMYEILIAFLQMGDQWWVSNLFNLLIFIFLLIRIPFYFPELSENQIQSIRFLFLVFPIFFKNAGSSIEFVPGLFFLFEANKAILNNHLPKVIFWTAVGAFTRLEFLPLLFIAQMTFWQRNWRISFSLTGIWFVYLIWVWNKNPPPFFSFNEGLIFYLTRIGVLVESMGIAILLVPILLFAFQKAQLGESWKMLGFTNLALFICFPFEWEYALPFCSLSILSLGIHLKFREAVLFGLVFLVTSLVKPEIRNWKNGLFSFRLEWPHTNRQASFFSYCMAQQIDFGCKTIVLEGATLFPFPVSRWEKILDNRIFHRKNSNFYCGERLSKSELDSLGRSGFQFENNLHLLFSSKDKVNHFP